MRKLLSFILILLVISIIACQPAKKEAMEKKDAAMEKTKPAIGTGEAVVDAVENDLNSINNVEKDLSSDELSDLYSGLSDVENI